MRLLSRRPTLKWSTARSGEALARAVSTGQDIIGTTEVDLAGMSISFDVPPDRDVWVVAKVAGCGTVTASATLTLKLTDGANAMKDQNISRSGTASRNYVTLPLDEIIPAGSGHITRKLRGICSTIDGITNIAAAQRVTLDAFVR